MTTIDTLEEGELPPPHKSKIQWGTAEIAAVVAIIATLLAGMGGIIRVAVAQDRTAQIAMDAKLVAEKAAAEVGGIKERLGTIEERVRRLPTIEEKLDRLMERMR